MVTAPRIYGGREQGSGIFGAFEKAVSNVDWWDGSIKDPWPNKKWDRFGGNVSGNPMWGTGGGTQELGNERGRNSLVGDPFYMNEWVMPGGRGGKMKFWAHKNNIAKHLVRALGDGAGAVGHGSNLSEIFPNTAETVTAVQITQYNSHIDIHGSLAKWVDSVLIAVKLEGTSIRKQQLRDSVQKANESERRGAGHWLNQ